MDRAPFPEFARIITHIDYYHNREPYRRNVNQPHRLEKEKLNPPLLSPSQTPRLGDQSRPGGSVATPRAAGQAGYMQPLTYSGRTPVRMTDIIDVNIPLYCTRQIGSYACQIGKLTRHS